MQTSSQFFDMKDKKNEVEEESVLTESEWLHVVVVIKIMQGSCSSIATVSVLWLMEVRTFSQLKNVNKKPTPQ